jgi:parvulin-like peptidyl-prolyl isomerase
VVLGLLLAGLALPASAAEREPPVIEAMPRLPEGYSLLDRIVAFVNEEIVTLHEFEQAVAVNRSLGAAGGSSGSRAESGLRDEALDALVDSILVVDAAKTLQLTVSDREAGWSDEEFAENIGKLGFTVEQYREMTRKEMLKARIVSIKVGSRVNVGESEVARVLEAEYYGGKFEDEVRASLILLRLSPTATKDEVKDAERLAEQLRRLAEAAPERFADLARKYSEHDPTRLSGGDLGWFTRGTFADDTLDKAAFSLAKGEVSDVLRNDLGLEVLMVTDRRKKPVEDPEVLRDRVYERLVQQEKIKVYLQWVKELRDQAYVEKRL